MLIVNDIIFSVNWNFIIRELASGNFRNIHLFDCRLRVKMRNLRYLQNRHTADAEKLK